MAARLSTSNSEHAHALPAQRAPVRFGMPWALIMAIGIVCAVEVFLRTRDPHHLIAYPELAASDDQTVTYKAVREHIDIDGSAEIALLGSSQMREGVWMPSLVEQIKTQLPSVRVANYALRGARVDAMGAVAEYLVRQATPPRVVIIGVSVRDVRGEAPDLPRAAVFWNLSQWMTEFRAHGFVAGGALPVVIRNAAGDVLYSLRYRDQLAMDLARPLKRFGIDYRREGNPIVVETTFQLAGGRGLKTLDLAMTRVSLRRMLARARDSYSWNQSPDPAPEMVDRLRQMLKVLKSRGIETILVEMDVAEVLQRQLDSAGMTKAFDDTVSRIAEETGVRYLPVEVRPLQLTGAHYSDLQHHNRPGAQLFGTWLVEQIVPIMKESPNSLPDSVPDSLPATKTASP